MDKKKLRAWLAEDKVTDVIAELLEQYPDNDDVVMVSNSHKDYSQKKYSGTAAVEELKVSKNQLVERLLKIIEQLSQEKIQSESFVHELSPTSSRTIDTLVLNLIPIERPIYLYIADIGEKFINPSTPIFSRKKKSDAKFKLKLALKEKNIEHTSEWAVREKKLFTFLDITNEKQPLRQAVDIGTIQRDKIIDFSEQHNYESVIRELFHVCLIKHLKQYKIEWVKNDDIFRFQPENYIVLRPRKIGWKKDVKEAHREVFSEVWNATETHIVCFRHLAFKCSFDFLDKKWYIVINPTWSFTTDGKHNSKFEPTYLSGLKKMENNQAVNNHFLFWADIIERVDNFMGDALHIFKFGTPPSLKTIGGVENDKWKSNSIVKTNNQKSSLNLFNE